MCKSETALWAQLAEPGTPETFVPGSQQTQECISCICFTLCSFPLEIEYLGLFETSGTLACAQLPYAGSRGWVGQGVLGLPFTRYQGSERSVLVHNNTGHLPEQNCVNVWVLFVYLFCFVHWLNWKLKRKLKLDQSKQDFSKLFLQGEILNKMLRFTKNAMTDCLDS